MVFYGKSLHFFFFSNLQLCCKNVQILIGNNLRSTRSEDTVCKASFTEQKTYSNPNSINNQINFKTLYNPQGTPLSTSNIGDNVPANVRFQNSHLPDEMDYVHAVKAGEDKSTSDLNQNVLMDKLTTCEKMKSTEHAIPPKCKAGYGLMEVRSKGMFLSSPLLSFTSGIGMHFNIALFESKTSQNISYIL